MNVANQILKALREAGRKGLLLEELTTGLELDAEIVTTTIEQLMSEGQIMAKQELEKTRYFINEQMTSDAEPQSLGDLNGCPCFHCPKISKCGARQPDSPISCSRLEEWLLSFDSS
ncbi:MAG: hypothetical protein ACTSYL_05870 [Candidatus Thorarchaeota archaeon]